MPFKIGNKLGAKKRLKRPLDKEVIAFKGYEGQKEKLKAVPDWQERLREFVDQLLSDFPKNG
ncbi:MAG TPA: hypothetical protein DCL61_25645 [Cyanobacteria bacterium UBA12227]|nr:hypothetical protein [Cyanobacteria bacterium UBA12227]HAX86869.1 hypothetical protein [Cyanobacteria bacterium UBA11370]